MRFEQVKQWRADRRIELRLRPGPSWLHNSASESVCPLDWQALRSCEQRGAVVVIGLDETQAGASGCSIDASVHCMQRLGQMGEPLVDYLRRDQVLYRSAGKDAWEHANLSNFWMSRKAGLVNDQTDVVNALCANKGEWETACYHPFHASWHNAMW